VTNPVSLPFTYYIESKIGKKEKRKKGKRKKERKKEVG
jgi:hypothetical protein